MTLILLSGEGGGETSITLIPYMCVIQGQQKYYSPPLIYGSTPRVCNSSPGLMQTSTAGLGVPPTPTLVEICQIQVPNSAVGAIIGTGGANIKQMMRDSGAYITVSCLTHSRLCHTPNVYLLCVRDRLEMLARNICGVYFEEQF